jgi:hypothetical protein
LRRAIRDNDVAGLRFVLRSLRRRGEYGRASYDQRNAGRHDVAQAALALRHVFRV